MSSHDRGDDADGAIGADAVAGDGVQPLRTSAIGLLGAFGQKPDQRS